MTTTPLPYILIQHAYFFGTAPNYIPPIANDSSISNFNQIRNGTQETLVPDPQCRRPDYTYTSAEVGAHKYVNHAYTWNEARAYCERDGAHLNIINSPAEAQTIVNILKEAKKASSWVGVHDFFEEGQYVTIHDTPLENTGFQTWDKWEPNNGGTKENCLFFHVGGALWDHPCDEKFSFVCEVPYQP